MFSLYVNIMKVVVQYLTYSKTYFTSCVHKVAVNILNFLDTQKCGMRIYQILLPTLHSSVWYPAINAEVLIYGFRKWHIPDGWSHKLYENVLLSVCSINTTWACFSNNKANVKYMFFFQAYLRLVVQFLLTNLFSAWSFYNT